MENAHAGIVLCRAEQCRADTQDGDNRADIEFLMTKATARRRGYATALVDWAAGLADERGYACYLDGGGRGMGMLEAAGFAARDLGHRYGEGDGPPPCAPMVRPRK